jgi:hypothetical protein
VPEDTLTELFARFTEAYAELPPMWNLAEPPQAAVDFLSAARDLAAQLAGQPVKVIETPEALSELTAETPWALVRSAALSKLAVGANAAVVHLRQIDTVRSAANIDNSQSQMFEAMMTAMYELENRSRVAHGMPPLPSRLKM